MLVDSQSYSLLPCTIDFVGFFPYMQKQRPREASLRVYREEHITQESPGGG
jgi:hypothetical protein